MTGIQPQQRTSDMTDQQTIAILNPCEFAEQCCNQRYREIRRTGRYLASIMLTVNVGEE